MSEDKFLKIVMHHERTRPEAGDNFPIVLALMMIAEAIALGKSKKALQHFLAIAKKIENIYGFTFEWEDKNSLENKNEPD